LTSGRQTGEINIGVGQGQGFASQIALSQDGKRLAANIYEKGWKTEVWDLDTQTRIFQSDTHSFSSMSSDGDIVGLWSAYTLSYEFWQVSDNHLLFTGQGLGYVHLFPDGRRFLADSHSLEIWDLESASRVIELAKRSEFDTHNLHISPDGNWWAAATRDQILEWDSSKYRRYRIH
jgi:hypothetical protein